MPTTRNPRRGSMQFWPRKRAKKVVARVRHPLLSSEAEPQMFAGYKVGMTHLLTVENNKNSPLKGKAVFTPATIIECPPLTIYGVNAYKRTPYGLTLSHTVTTKKTSKTLLKRLSAQKKEGKTLDSLNPEDYKELRLLVHSQVEKTGLGKKKPELFEVKLGGKVSDQLAYAKKQLGKDISVDQVLKEGSQVDSHSVSKGKGNQGPVKRFGIKIRRHKSEKTKRGPGSLGPWHGPTTYRVAHAGQTGYHLRTEHNKWILKIEEDASKVQPKGDWLRYGKIKNKYLIIKGSVPGPSKRLITFTKAARPNKKIPTTPPQINYIHIGSKQ